ncbi:MAG: hypothetical protein AAB426_11255, partial [Myxococcota bacterium]
MARRGLERIIVTAALLVSRHALADGLRLQLEPGYAFVDYLAVAPDGARTSSALETWYQRYRLSLD